MNKLDIVLLIFASVGCIYGYIKGLIKQLTFGAGIAIGLLQAILFSSEIGGRLSILIEWPPIICTISAFIGIVIVTMVIFKILGVVANTILEQMHLNFINKTLGAVFSTMIAILLLFGCVEGTNLLFPEIELTSKTSQNNSLLYKNISVETATLIEEVKEEIDEKTK